MSRRLAALGCVFCLCALNPGAPARADHDPAQRVDLAAAGWPLSAFALVDHEGRAITQAALQGRWTFLLFGDSRCATPCADALAALTGLYRHIAGTEALKQTRVIFISLDPEHETPERLRRYLAPYDARFIGATGPRAALRSLGEDFGFSAVGETKGHAGRLWLIGPDGCIRAEYLPPFDVPLLTAAFLRTRARG